MVTLRQGEQVGRYAVGSLLAEGGFAKIYRGWDPVEERHVALKVPLSRYPTHETLEEFRKEARENRKLRHPNILPILDLEVVRGFPVLVTPLGRCSLADKLDHPVPARRALRLALQMMAALAHAHRRHVLHLDVKPENLVVMPGQRIALTDFGAARRGSRTVHGTGIGTPDYMAPEQAAGRPSPRSDVYAAGLVLRDMLQGRDRVPRRRAPRGLAAALHEVADRATRPDPAGRYKNAVEMLETLRRIQRRFSSP